ncbi:hypothetical protein CUMW_266900 [Citrus unshiu]|uniref:Calmodulin binding protein-like N-terminal domain-containing protein n=1 Tax=Citrus unshiu TaxID=55188 RepID=A0A2H5QVX4_CITUN|nr:hypothetical protein CUMW_266900 [Citrus unshiu]
MAAKWIFSESISSDSDQFLEEQTRTRPPASPLCNWRSGHGEFLQGLLFSVRAFAETSGMLSSDNALESSSLKLTFSKELSLSIFTGSKITDIENNPFQIVVVETRSGGRIAPANLSQPIKIVMMVLDGDFPPGDHNDWSQEEFKSNIVKERTEKRPLLTGDVNVTIINGVAPVEDIEFTDN